MRMTDKRLGTPSCSIVIRAKDEARFIGKVLAKVFAQDCQARLEVIVLDSGSKDETVAIASQ